MYGWVKTDSENNSISVSVKYLFQATFQRPCNCRNILVKKAKYFNHGLQNLLDKKIKVNSEYYVDSIMDELIKID